MKYKTKLKLVVCTILFSTITISTWAITNSNNNKSDAVEHPTTVNTVGRINASLQVLPINESIDKADLIAKVEIVKTEKEISKPSQKTILAAKIIETIKADSRNENIDVIHILQNGNSTALINGNKIFQPAEQYVLFLKRAVGEEYDLTNTYWILGEETNIYEDLGNGLLSKWALTDADLTEVEEKQTASKNAVSGTQILSEDKFKAFIQNTQD
ncbi:hypothetical protein [Cohnella fermenti]|uniref:Uncharacterized protein n=1 Tax=Cohnella fermenti TaxID=2565925 RepID=A0A4S4C8A6_9BACL|nr:hypothetical protein [Cohnella fermenti]THF84245.1 hypothetical protein E6C55_02835 [Cohnella fermenti]